MKHSRRYVMRSLAAVGLCVVCALLLGAPGNASAQTRDPVNPLDPAKNSPIWPFASTSPWNMPIGSGAQYVPINLAVPNDPGNPPSDPATNWAQVPGIHDEYIVLTPTAPFTDINYSDVAWTGGDRCPFSGMVPTLLVQVPVPADYVVPSSGGDNSAAFLMPDNRTIIQAQPFTRCDAGLPATSVISFNYVDIYGDGRWGSHGGSQLSAIGGSIHLGELRPGIPVRHAISISVDSSIVLHSCQTLNDCFRWPAYTADSTATADHGPGSYGGNNPNAVAGMKMGALLAIPASTNIDALGLESIPGQMLAWTLQNYGAYIVDTTGGPGFNIDADIGPNGTFAGSKREEFENDFKVIDQFGNEIGMPFEERVNDGDGTHGNPSLGYPWTRDVQKLMQALYLVDNNGPDSIGGGGTPLQPLAPPLALTRFENDISAIVRSPDTAWVQRGTEIAALSDGTGHSSDVAGASATFTFTGTALSWIGLKCNVCGMANVSIDGGTAQPVDTGGQAAPGSAGLASEVVFAASGLSAGESHTVVITVTGTNSINSSGAHILIDAFDVTP
ncbi:MAG TPA: hypothetical protein VK572_14980 [Burkholderiales bacterium]|nr:hypothetical protein [Burkholderiales bacterium]